MRALLWIAYILLIGYGFASLSLDARTWRRRVLLGLAALLAVLVATYYLATHTH
jgi:hypothetical protein